MMLLLSSVRFQFHETSEKPDGPEPIIPAFLYSSSSETALGSYRFRSRLLADDKEGTSLLQVCEYACFPELVNKKLLGPPHCCKRAS
jgi:hypothetical protein